MSGEQAAPAADSPSIESRIGNIFGGPPQEPKPQATQGQAEPEVTEQSVETTEQEAPEPEFTEIEYEGQRYQVPPELKEAFIRQSDYTKKTTEVAKNQKLIEHQMSQLKTAQVQAEFERSVTPQLAEIGRLEAQLAQYDQLDWRSLDAENRTLHMLEMQRLEKAVNAKKGEIDGKRQEHQQKLNEQLQTLKSQANDVLKARIPGWSEAVAKEVGSWALQNGFTQEEISSIYDPRHAEVLWKAAQYDKARTTAKPSVTAAKTAKPSSANPMPSHVKEMLNFRNQVKKTQPGSVEHKKLVENRVGSLFAKRQ